MNLRDKIELLVSRRDRAISFLDTRQDRLDDTINPILKALGHNNLGTIKSCIFNSDGSYSGCYEEWFRGECDSREFIIPAQILQNENPVKAAEDYKTSQDNLKKKREIDRKFQEYMELKKKFEE